MEQSTLFYDERFLESWVGPIVTDPATAIVELVANCWDAYATEVHITWPALELGHHFRIRDNGHGMTEREFRHIWRTIAYNRVAAKGATVEPPVGVIGQPRPVFGRNGKGRFAAFCFAREYEIVSRKQSREFRFTVRTTTTKPLVLQRISVAEAKRDTHGTEIIGRGEVLSLSLTAERAREVIGSRFLANPAFQVSLNGRRITFSDIPDLLAKERVEVPGYGNVTILHIDTKKADKTTKQHGIAWWVHRRAVGECRWSGSDYQRILDGRTSEAKRFTFIVQADFLNEHDAVLEDWSGFRDDSVAWQKTRDVVQDRIRAVILSTSKSERDSKRAAVIENVGNQMNTLPPLSKDRVNSFVSEVVDNCPNFGEQEITQLTTILATLEQSKSRYGLLELLHNQTPGDLDALHDVLQQWTIGMAKLVLDEIQTRLRLIKELRQKIEIAGIDEVHELQPLFEKGLWMFGAEFESIEFTANKGMTTVIRELFAADASSKASRNRPDFVILADSSVGLYSRPSYNENFDEDGCAHLVIIDLKTTGLALGSAEKEQLWKYVKELKARGYVRPNTVVSGFILGDRFESGEEQPRAEGASVQIVPMLYETILTRAEKRLLNLYGKVQDAPFLRDQHVILQEFMRPIPVRQSSVLGT